MLTSESMSAYISYNPSRKMSESDYTVVANILHTEGITKITLEDVRYAEAFHCVIKLIGSVKRLADGKIEMCIRDSP